MEATAELVEYVLQEPCKRGKGRPTIIYRDGKVKYLGLCEVSLKTLFRAHAVHPISVVQVEYEPFQGGIEKPSVDLMNTAK